MSTFWLIVFLVAFGVIALWLAGTNTAVGRWLRDIRSDIDEAVGDVRDELADAISDMQQKLDRVPGIARQRLDDIDAHIDKLRADQAILDGVVSDHSDAIVEHAAQQQNPVAATALQSEVATRHQQTASLAAAIDALNARVVSLEQRTAAPQAAPPASVDPPQAASA